MPQSLFRSFSADADQRSVSLTRSDGFPGAFRLSSASIWEGCHQHVRRDSRMAKQEWSALKRVLMFTLQMAIGAVACAGAILAIFAWTGAKLAPTCSASTRRSAGRVGSVQSIPQTRLGILQEIRWVLKDTAGMELPPGARKTIDLEGRW